VIDGHWGFGFHVNAKAMALTIEKAKTANVAACTVFRQSHVGRLGAYPLMAVKEGMIGLATADSGRSPKIVAPFGGREAAARHQSDFDRGTLGPRGALLSGYGNLGGGGRKDCALGRARRRNSEGWIVDSEGRQTTDPRQWRKGGALLPLGGTRLQGQRSGRDGRGIVRAAHRPGLRGRAPPGGTMTDASCGVQRRRVPGP